jgi:hypothetical protein
VVVMVTRKTAVKIGKGRYAHTQVAGVASEFFRKKKKKKEDKRHREKKSYVIRIHSVHDIWFIAC